MTPLFAARRALPPLAARRRVLGLAAAPRRLAQSGDAEALREAGALVEVTVGPASAVAEGLRARGEAPPPARRLRALIDTGASITGIASGVAREMGLVQTGTTTIGGVTGASQQPVYAASLVLGDVELDPITVAGLQVGGAFDVLVGRDVLRQTVLVYDGVRGGVSVAGGAGGAPVAVRIAGALLAAGALGAVIWALLGRSQA